MDVNQIIKEREYECWVLLVALFFESSSICIHSACAIVFMLVISAFTAVNKNN